MRSLLTFFSLLLFNIAFAQGTTEWIGPQGQFLRLKKDTAYLAYPYGNRYPCRISNDTMILVEYIPTENMVYTLDKSRKDTLIIKAINDNAYQKLRTHEPVALVARNKLYDPSFTFQKVFFSLSGGMGIGNFSGVQYEVDSSGAIYFTCMPGRQNKKGLFKGYLSPAQLRQLNEIIKRSAIDHVTIPKEPPMVDAASVSFKFCYQNKIKTISGMGVPYILQELQVFIDPLVYQVDMHKVSDVYGLPDE